MASGGSVIGLKYNGGVLLAADTLLSYGSLAKWPNIPRIRLIGKHSAVAATGDYADFQDVCRELDQLINEDAVEGPEMKKSPEQIFNYLHRTMYGKRCDFEPALCQFVFIGSCEGKEFLGVVDDIGTKWSTDSVATGYAAHIALPILRKAIDTKGEQPLTRDEAMAALQDCLRVIFYRECRAVNKFQIADACENKVTISDPFSVDTEWGHEGFSFEKTAIIR